MVLSNSSASFMSLFTTNALNGCVCCLDTDCANCDSGEAPTTLKSGASTPNPPPPPVYGAPNAAIAELAFFLAATIDDIIPHILIAKAAVP